MKNNLILPSNKSFGITFAILFLILTYIFRQNQIIFFSFLLLSLLFLVLSLSIPKIFSKMNYLWMLLALKIGNIASIIISILIFYIIVTPVGFLKKAFKVLKIKDKYTKKNTYWIKKNETVEFRDQF